MPYTLEQIASFIGAHLWGREEAEVSWLLTDSRSLCFPEDTLFFALETRRNDGHRYIPELYQRGVRSFVVSRLPEDLAAYPDASFLQVLCPLKALQRLAERRREEFDIPVVGITGSNGKTIVKEWLYQLLSPEKAVARSPRSYNSQIGVPLSVWGLNEQSEVGLFEAGISQCGEMDALQSIIQPTVGVFTCLGEAHRENFSSKEQKCMEKLKLFKDAQVLVYGIDDPCVAACVNLSAFKGEYMAWSLTRRDVPVAVSAVEKEGSTTRVTYIYKGEEHAYVIPFIDDASLANSVSCLCVCLYLGMAPDTIARHGVVSRAVVEEMARGVQRALHVDCAIATSGIAGPDGATPGKPVGTLALAVACGEKLTSVMLTAGSQGVRNIDRFTHSALLQMIDLLHP